MSLEDNNSLSKQRITSFFSFLKENYELSKFILPKVKPVNDSLDSDEIKMLVALMEEKDFYEINSIIKDRYKNS